MTAEVFKSKDLYDALAFVLPLLGLGFSWWSFQFGEGGATPDSYPGADFAFDLDGSRRRLRIHRTKPPFANPREILQKCLTNSGVQLFGAATGSNSARRFHGARHPLRRRFLAWKERQAAFTARRAHAH